MGSSVSNVIVNADDYGMTPEISITILQAAKDRLIQSVSADVCNGIARSDARRIIASRIPIGLHLNLTQGRPVGSGDGIAGLLVMDGRFKSASTGLNSHPDPEPLLAELRNQFERFQIIFDRAPTHIDSHQHFTYLHPIAFEAMLKLATENKLPIRSPRPFTHGESLRSFCERVNTRYGVQPGFEPEDRAVVLNKILNQYCPTRRSQELYLDFDQDILNRARQEGVSAEMIIHPHLERG